MEPTPAQLKDFNLVSDIMEWAQLKGDAAKGLLDVLGLEESDHVRVMAAVSDDDWKESIGRWRVGNADATPAQRAKAVVARGAAYLAATGRRLGVQVQQPLSLRLATGAMPLEAGPSSASSLTRFKFNTVINQASEVELTVLEGDAIKVAYVNYKAIFGTFPPPGEELTTEQLTAVKTILDADVVPYVDFAIWGPHGNRVRRKLKLHGVTFSSDGTLIPTEVAGPPSFDQWSAAYTCLRTALVSWKAVELGRVDQYARLIARYVSRYGQSSWYQIYQADVRCRSEHMERIRRRGDEERAVAEAAGQTHSMDPTRPWDWVWSEVVKDSDFWRVELEEPALMALTRASRSAPASSNLASAPSAKRLAPEGLSTVMKVAKMHEVDGNTFKTNRKGMKLCEGFNKGDCPHNPRSTVCPRDSDAAHQCSRCLDSTHGQHACFRTDFPAQKPLKQHEGGKSRGYGGGKGKGKHKGRWQY